MSDQLKRISPPLGLKEELVVNEIEERNWKGILISLLVIASICSLIFLSIVLLSPHFGLNVKNGKLGLDEILIKGYERKGYNGTWISGTELLYVDNTNKTLYIYNIESKHKRILAEGSTLKEKDIKKYSVSADRRYVLLSHDIRKTGSHSFTAKYEIFDTMHNISVPLKMDSNEDFQHVGWAPNANQHVVIHRNNIYFFFRVGGEPIEVTSNGREGFIYNGIPDLMYEEHILQSPLTYWWHNDGTRLCYASFDNTLVDQMPYVLYSDSNISQSLPSDGFPKVYTYPYPKPGREISKVTLTIVDISASNPLRSRTEITPPEEIRGRDYYLTAPVVWISESSVAIVWSRRAQNYTVVGICKEEDNWVCHKLVEQQLNGPSGWIFVNDGPIISEDKKFLFMRLPVADGPFGTYSHVAMIYTDGGNKYFLTHGQYVVTKIFAYRSDLHTIYFGATMHNEPGSRHIFSVTDMNSANPRHVECLSCHISQKCWFNSAIFSPNARYYVSECLGPEIPMSFLVSVDDNQIMEILEDNYELMKWSKERSLPKIKYLTIPTEKGFTIRVQLILPQTLAEDEDIKYPSIIQINNQPGSQSVSYEHKLDWSRFLASRKEYISIQIDGRGTGFQGDRYMYEIYHHLGEIETQDLLVTIKYLKKKFAYIDEDKIVVWGREYGGFLTVNLLASDPTVQCGIAVSPITNWNNYLSVFSERYMGMPWPQHNYINYEKTDLTRRAKELKGKTFLLIHGTSDKRVNIHHSMLLMKSLTNAGVHYKVQLYPDSGVMESWDLLVRLHFYRTMEDFFAKCFQVEDEEGEDLLPLTKVIKSVQKSHH